MRVWDRGAWLCLEFGVRCTVELPGSGCAIPGVLDAEFEF